MLGGTLKKNRAEELLWMLVDVREASRGNTALLQRLVDGELIALSRQYAIERTVLTKLKYHEKQWLRAVAVGKTMNKAVLSGRTAARVLGMWVVATSTEQAELMLPSGAVPGKHKWGRGIVYRKGAPCDTEVLDIDGVRVTDHVRTAFDIAVTHGFKEGLVAFDWLLMTGTVTKRELKRRIQMMRGRRGVPVLRQILVYAVDNSQSAYESYARALLIEDGITCIRTQVQIGPFTVDMMIGRLCVEVDGEEKYDGVTYKPLDETLRRERDRAVYIQNQGYPLRRVQPAELLRDPGGFVRMVREALMGIENGAA